MNGKRIRAYMQELIEQKDIPYLDFSLSVADKEVFRFYAGKDGATGKEKLFLWSCTKPLTVVGAMKLVEEGKLSLDDEVSKYIPEFNSTFLSSFINYFWNFRSFNIIYSFYKCRFIFR